MCSVHVTLQQWYTYIAKCYFIISFFIYYGKSLRCNFIFLTDTCSEKFHMTMGKKNQRSVFKTLWVKQKRNYLLKFYINWSEGGSLSSKDCLHVKGVAICGYALPVATDLCRVWLHICYITGWGLQSTFFFFNKSHEAASHATEVRVQTTVAAAPHCISRNKEHIY